jgi:hypothetical protein
LRFVLLIVVHRNAHLAEDSQRGRDDLVASYRDTSKCGAAADTFQAASLDTAPCQVTFRELYVREIAAMDAARRQPGPVKIALGKVRIKQLSALPQGHTKVAPLNLAVEHTDISQLTPLGLDAGQPAVPKLHAVELAVLQDGP